MLNAMFLSLQQLTTKFSEVDFAAESDQELTQLEPAHAVLEVLPEQGIHFFMIHAFHSWQDRHQCIELWWLIG